VHAIRTVDPAVTRVGAVTTEGDAASRADALRAQGLDGTGVVVGVISDGIDSLTDAQATNDLPDVQVPNDLRCQKGAGDEGTALLEIVHDLAPGAKLLFSGPSSRQEGRSPAFFSGTIRSAPPPTITTWFFSTPT